MNRSLSLISAHQRQHLLRYATNPTLVSGLVHRRFFRVSAPHYAESATSSSRPPLPPAPPVKSASTSPSGSSSSSSGGSDATIDVTQRQLRNLTIMSAFTLALLAFNFYSTTLTTTITLIDVEQERHLIEETKKVSQQQAESIKRDLQMIHDALAKLNGTGNTTSSSAPASSAHANTNNSSSSSAQSKPTGIASYFSGFGQSRSGGSADDTAAATSGSGSGRPPKPAVHPSLAADKNIAGTASCPSSPHVDVGTKYQSAMLPPLSPDHPQPPLHKADMSTPQRS